MTTIRNAATATVETVVGAILMIPVAVLGLLIWAIVGARHVLVGVVLVVPVAVLVLVGWVTIIGARGYRRAPRLLAVRRAART